MTIKISKIVCFVIILVTFSCKDSNNYTTIKQPEPEISTTTEKTHKVVAKEFMNAGYTYVRVSEDGNEYWIVLQNTKIEIGNTYYFEGGLKKLNFKSNELNRTFDEILFVDAIRSNEKETSEIELIPQPEDGISIKDILLSATSLSESEKEVIIKGKAVKINRNILDRNWVHLRDGTNLDGKADLTITTQDSVNVGDVVTFKGKVIVNKDFGHGYVYPILVEEGKLIK